jgi:cell division protein FtsQ
VSEALAFHSPKTSKTEQLVNRLLWAVIILLVLFIIGELLFHFVVSPRLVIKNISVESDLALSGEDVLALVGLSGKVYFFSLNAGEIREKLEAYPLIKRAVVEKQFPDGLKISIFGRLPLALAIAEGAGGVSVPLALDDEGVVFQIGSSITDYDLPVISGLKFSQIRVGTKLPGSLAFLMADLERLKRQFPDLFRLISEVRVTSRAGDQHELVLCLLTHTIKLRFGGSISGGSLKSAVMLLDLIEKQGFSDTVQEIDFRTGEVVYRIKEG